MSEPMLSVEDLIVRFHLKRGTLTAVNGVSFNVNKARRSAWLVNLGPESRSLPVRSCGCCLNHRLKSPPKM